jgi:hypothetical protein
MKIIEQSSDFVKYDFSSVIKEQDCEAAKRIIKQIIESGNYFENSPKFQTKENIFNRSEDVWLKFRMSFMFAAFMYLGREVKITNLQSWSFITSLNHPEDREKLWHNHQFQGAKTVSGIFYLHIPGDVDNYDTCGTEFAPNGLEDSERVFVKPTPYSWLIYPGKIWHRPGIVQSFQDRYVIAADMEF